MRMSLSWKLRRLRAMGLPEIAYRVRQIASQNVQRAGFGRASLAPPAYHRTGRPWIEPIPQSFDRDRYRLAAERILGGHFAVFALGDASLGFPPQWNRDPKTGTEAPLVFGKTLDYRVERLVGNIKYLWEPNRHLELVTLAQAWHLTRDERYLVGSQALLESWFAQCPYPRGPNWTSSLELGIRLLNWSFAWHLLGGEDCTLFRGRSGDAFRQRWLNSIYQHCHFISGHLSRHSSANNHLLGELLGLFIAGLTWPCWPESRRWLDRSRDEFEEEVLVQNTPDGVNREQGIWYQHEVADMMLIAALTGRANGVEFGAEFWNRLEAMLEFVASIMDAGGHVPAWGDSDDAVMVRFCPVPGHEVFRSQLATGAVIFGRGDFKTKAQRFDDKSRWLLGDAASATFDGLSADLARTPVRVSFPEGGYYVLGGDFESPDEVRIVADAGPLGYLSIAAHGHADALSFTLSAGGKEILIDPGTYAYHTEKSWRDYFRGTTAHNTVCIDGLDQSVSGGNFLWTRHAVSCCETYESGVGRDRWVASHDGYSRLPSPALHRRELCYSKVERILRVKDEVSTLGGHEVQILWHFSEACTVVLDVDCARIKRDEIEAVLCWPAGCTARLYIGSVAPPLGWRSTRFDVRTPCPTLILSTTTSGQWVGETIIRIGSSQKRPPVAETASSPVSTSGKSNARRY
jgi:hypothetical protein